MIVRLYIKKTYMGILLATITLLPCIASAGAPLETETARLLKAGQFEIQSAFEYSTSNEGKEYAVPLELEYGITNDLQILVEPVTYRSVKTKSGKRKSGMGDTETTLFYRFAQETESMPAMAIAGEVKFPTASGNLGTKKYDYTPYFVFSKKMGDFDTHLNLGYSFIGKTAPVNGESSENTVNYSLATEYPLSETIKAVAETSGKLAGGSFDEAAALVGVRYALSSTLGVSFAVQYDKST